MQVSFFNKDLFLDREAIRKAVAEAGQDPDRLTRAAHLVRSEARRSMRFVKKKSTTAPPGKPPRAHTPDPKNLRSIDFFWDAALRGARIGSAVFPGHKNGIQSVPQVHEFGGLISQNVRVRVYRGPRAKSGRKATRRQLAALRRRSKSAKGKAESREERLKMPVKRVIKKYPPRPYMWPALLKAIHRLPRIWRGSITRLNVSPAVRKGRVFAGASRRAA